jgi:hypothetical protein
MFRDNVCATCRHYRGMQKGSGKMPTCTAFPDGVPLDILRGIEDHMNPLEGDNGIQYEASDHAIKHGFDMREYLNSFS